MKTNKFYVCPMAAGKHASEEETRDVQEFETNATWPEFIEQLIRDGGFAEPGQAGLFYFSVRTREDFTSAEAARKIALQKGSALIAKLQARGGNDLTVSIGMLAELDKVTRIGVLPIRDDDRADIVRVNRAGRFDVRTVTRREALAYRNWHHKVLDTMYQLQLETLDIREGGGARWEVLCNGVSVIDTREPIDITPPVAPLTHVKCGCAVCSDAERAAHPAEQAVKRVIGGEAN